MVFKLAQDNSKRTVNVLEFKIAGLVHFGRAEGSKIVHFRQLFTRGSMKVSCPDNIGINLNGASMTAGSAREGLSALFLTSTPQKGGPK